ncbi:MAG: hypothetical protein IKE45_05810 [Halomonas sp.]|nr:hypothetical protein [Halomonas sp.]MBR2513529.1 hypothetical protein [Halomonas sp.]
MKPTRQHHSTKKLHKKNHFAVVVFTVLSLGATFNVEANGSVSELNKGSRVSQYIAHIDHTSFRGNISIIQQQGNDNQANVIQSRSLSYQLANFSHINQRGNNNQASIQQASGNNIGVIWQLGDNHTANISQQGNNLSLRADIDQLGFSGDVTISQSGSGLRGVSVQQQNYSGNTRAVTIDTY